MNQGAARTDINLMQQFKLLLTGLMVLFVLGWVSQGEPSTTVANHSFKASVPPLGALNAKAGARIGRQSLPPMPCVIERAGMAGGAVVRES